MAAHRATDQLYPLLHAHPYLILQAGDAALTALASAARCGPQPAGGRRNPLPPGRNIDLDTGIAALTARLAEHRLTSSDLAEHARIHDNLGFRLHYAGLHQQALTAAQNANQTWRQLVALNRDAYLPEPGQVADQLRSGAGRDRAAGRGGPDLPGSGRPVRRIGRN